MRCLVAHHEGKNPSNEEGFSRIFYARSEALDSIIKSSIQEEE
jgi:hypothetical protein